MRLFAIAAAFMLIGPAAADAAFPGQNGKIAFTRDVGGNEEIYVVNPDGTGLQNLTNHPADESGRHH